VIPGLSLYSNRQAQIQRSNGLSPLSEILQAYLLSAKVDEKSMATIDSYNERISVFIRFLETNKLPLDPIYLNSFHVRLFLGYLRDKNLNSSTINAYYRALQTFFRWIMAEGITENYPLYNIKAPKVARTVIKPFSNEDIENLFLLCAGNDFINVRNLAILMILLDTGLRLSEISNIQLKDVDFDHETIKVLGKGAKERIVRIGKITQKALLRYLLARKNSTQPLLWLNRQNMPICKGGVQTAIERLCVRAGITDTRPSIHTFRHTAAICFLRNGGSEFLLQIMLGHSTLMMTRRYVSTLGTDDMIKAHTRASPVDNLRFVINIGHKNGKRKYGES
jgi:site-specific recombinase XerD